MLGMLPGDVAGAADGAARSSPSRSRSRRSPAAAQVLRIQEFGEARDLILGRLKRMVG